VALVRVAGNHRASLAVAGLAIQPWYEGSKWTQTNNLTNIVEALS
jgi:hypothetical protein